MSDFKNWAAWCAYRDRPTGLNSRWAFAGGTFDRSRNAEKRDPATRRDALIERIARRRRESWKRETRNPNLGRPYGPPRVTL